VEDIARDKVLQKEKLAEETDIDADLRTTAGDLGVSIDKIHALAHYQVHQHGSDGS
jgi:hypothetical protein